MSIFIVTFLLPSMAQDAAITINSKGKSFKRSTPLSLKYGNSFTPLAVIFSEDFSGGIPGSWMITDSAGNGEIWTVAPGPQGGSVLIDDTLKSPTATNGIALVDDDFYGNNSTVTSTSLITPAIDATGLTVVKVSFYDYFRMYNVGIDEGVLYVSNDGTTWTEVFRAETGLAQNDATPNPRFNDIDISSIAANQPTVYLNFTFRGNWGYWWQIDDISVYEPEAIDGGVISIDPIPAGCSLSANTSITLTIGNAGLNDISNFDVSYTVNSGAPVTEIYTGTITAGNSANYTFTATADLSAPGTYSIDVYTTIASDGNATNDTASLTTENFVPYDISANSLPQGFEPADDFTGWSILDANTDNLTWDYAYNPNFTVFANTGDYCFRVGSTDDWLVTPCLDLISGTNYTLSYYHHHFNAPANPATVNAYIGTSNTPAAMTQQISNVTMDAVWTQSVTTFTVPATGTYYIGFHASGTGSPILRVDDILVSFGTGITEEDNSHLISIYPNPTTGVLFISSKHEAKQTAIEVLNNLGQVVYSMSASKFISNQLDLSSFASGIYSVRFTTEKETIIKKISLQNN